MDALLQVRISAELKQRLKAIEDKYGVPSSELTRRAVTELVEKMEKVKTPLPSRG